MTVSPLPGSLKRSEVLGKTKDYTPLKVPPPKHGTAAVFVGVVLLLLSLMLVVEGLLGW